MVRCNVRMQFNRSVYRTIVDTQIYEDLVLNAPCSNYGEMLYGKSNNSDYIYADWHQPRYPRVIPDDTNDAMWVICSNSLSVKISLSGPRTRIIRKKIQDVVCVCGEHREYYNWFQTSRGLRHTGPDNIEWTEEVRKCSNSCQKQRNFNDTMYNCLQRVSSRSFCQIPWPHVHFSALVVVMYFKVSWSHRSNEWKTWCIL